MEITMNDYPSRITLGKDGIYRWSYDMDMWHNHYMFFKMLKLIGIITALCIYPIMIFAMSSDGALLKAILIATLIVLAALAVTALIYAICALVMHGSYRLYFEMDESAIALVRTPRTKAAIDALAAITFASGIAAGQPGKALASGMMIGGTNQGIGITPFSSILKVNPKPQYDVIDIWQWFGGNQIYMCSEDYEFVKNFILEHKGRKHESA